MLKCYNYIVVLLINHVDQSINSFVIVPVFRLPLEHHMNRHSLKILKLFTTTTVEVNEINPNLNKVIKDNLRLIGDKLKQNYQVNIKEDESNGNIFKYIYIY